MALTPVYSNSAGLVDPSGDDLGTTNNPLRTETVLNPILFNEHAHQHTGVTSTLTIATSSAGTDRTITVASAVGFVAGDQLQISNGAIEPSFATIISIATNTFTLDRFVDFGHAIGTVVEVIVTDLRAVAGSLATPQEFIIKPQGGAIVHIQRLTIAMVHGTAGDLGLFGNLSSLANGVLIRVIRNGQYRTLTNWKINADLKDDMFDVVFDTRSSGGGTFGTTGRWTFERFGTEIRLDDTTNDQLEIYIQDDLTILAGFEIKAQGHREINE